MTESDLTVRLQSSLTGLYTLDRELGGGGMSRVFLATETALDRTVVLKVLPPELAQAVSTERFRQEIRLAARLHHPHIVPLLAAGQTDGLLYYTMPFVEGESLRAQLAASGELPVHEAVRLLRDVAAALAYAHERGIVHRDIKPDNVLIAGGEGLVTDFGVAKALSAAATDQGSGLTSLGVALGTPAYMAPEQAAADPHVDQRADIYAFGCLAYELLTGQPPFVGRTPQALLAAQATQAPESCERRRPGLPPDLTGLVMRCLGKRPADRPQTAVEVLHTLDGVLTPAAGLAPTAVSPAIRFNRLRFRIIEIAAAAGVLAVVAGIGTWWLGARPSAPLRRIERMALLPLENATGDASQAFVADGLTREFISALTSGGVRVIGYASVSRYAAPGTPLDRIAGELRVDAVAVGALRQTSPRLQVALELTDPISQENLWARTYTVDSSDIAGLPSLAARELAGAVAGRKPPTIHAIHAPPSAVRPSGAAYAEFLLGRHASRAWTPEGYQRTIDHYSRAVTLDSSFAAAWAGLAAVHATYVSYYDWVPRDAYTKAQAAAERALGLDETIGEAHLALAVLKQFRDWDWAGAEREFRRAIELEPSSTAHDLYGWFLMATGRADEAVAMGLKAVDIDPTAAPVHSDFSGLLREAGDLERALDEAITATRLDPAHAESHLALASAAALLHRHQEAWAAYDRYEDLFGRRLPAIRAVIFAQTGRTAEARSLLADRELYAGGGGVFSYDAMKAHATLGEHERAIHLLRLATDRREFWWPTFTVWDPLRTDRRFQELVERMGLSGAGG